MKKVLAVALAVTGLLAWTATWSATAANGGRSTVVTCETIGVYTPQLDYSSNHDLVLNVSGTGWALYCSGKVSITTCLQKRTAKGWANESCVSRTSVYTGRGRRWNVTARARAHCSGAYYRTRMVTSSELGGRTFLSKYLYLGCEQ